MLEACCAVSRRFSMFVLPPLFGFQNFNVCLYLLNVMTNICFVFYFTKHFSYYTTIYLTFLFHISFRNNALFLTFLYFYTKTDFNLFIEGKTNFLYKKQIYTLLLSKLFFRQNHHLL